MRFPGGADRTTGARDRHTPRSPRHRRGLLRGALPTSWVHQPISRSHRTNLTSQPTVEIPGRLGECLRRCAAACHEIDASLRCERRRKPARRQPCPSRHPRSFPARPKRLCCHRLLACARAFQLRASQPQSHRPGPADPESGCSRAAAQDLCTFAQNVRRPYDPASVAAENPADAITVRIAEPELRALREVLYAPVDRVEEAHRRTVLCHLVHGVEMACLRC